MAKVLVVDDEESIVWAFRKLLEGLGHSCIASGTAERGLLLAREHLPDLVFLDVKLPGVDGLAVLEEMRRIVPQAKFIIMTAHGTLETAVRAHRLGAAEYLLKPLDLDVTRDRVTTLLEGVTLDPEVEKLRRSLAAPLTIVGNSPAMQEVFKQVATSAPSVTTVLLVGESGTGKELLARAIHQNSARSNGPFEAVNCASIPETLLESELYGHEVGAFTDAIRTKPGKFEIAHGGTLFLDEVGDLPLTAQVKLLRFLEERRFEHVGGTTPISVDVRIVSATNQDLESKVREEMFREDLYFRLNVIRIHVPPLRERREDIPGLVAHFINKVGGAGISQEAMVLLKTYRWPGNVRELRNAIERATVLSRNGPIRPEHLPDSILSGKGHDAVDLQNQVEIAISQSVQGARKGDLYREVEERWERTLFSTVLKKTQGNQVRAAEFLGINRMTLRRKMDQYEL